MTRPACSRCRQHPAPYYVVEDTGLERHLCLPCWQADTRARLVPRWWEMARMARRVAAQARGDSTRPHTSTRPN